MALPGLIAARNGLRAKAWPSVEGTLKRVEIVERGSQFDLNDAVSFPAVRYSYEVAGKRYSGDRLSFGLGGGNLASRWAIRGLSVGASVRVFYDPAKPSQSVLRPGVAPSAALLIAAGGICVAGALAAR